MQRRASLDLSTIQQAARAGRITWRYHALRRARERDIAREEAIRVMTEGEIIDQRPDDTPYPMCLMMAPVEERRPLYVALGYDGTDDRIYVITVHWLDPDKWQDPWTRRRQT
jgi:hypothetical protein